MNTRLLLTLSVAANIVALVVIGALWKSSPDQTGNQSVVAGSPAIPVAPSDTVLESTPPSPPTNQLADATTTFDWRTVESTDYRHYIANLRAIGCPSETIQDIIVADVNKLYESRRKELRHASTNRFQFWKTGNPLGNLLNQEKMAKNQELANEKRNLIKSLLGSDYVEKPDLSSTMTLYEEMFDFVPANKQNQLLEVEQSFAGRLMESMKDAQKGNFTAMRDIMREKEAELSKILSPQEKEEYDLRLSQTAALMRMQMGDFQPTEQEFRDIFKLQKQLDDEFGIQGMRSRKPEDVQKIGAAQKEVETQLRTVLGEDRFLEYRYNQDLSKSTMNKIAEEYQVPRRDALKVFDVQAVAQEQAKQIRADSHLSSEQRQRALDALRAETEREMGKFISKPALDAYVERGSWVKNLNKPAAGKP